MANSSVVVCLDASGSMSQRSYFQPAQTDAATFVNIMQNGDSLGVTAFSNNAWIAYPASSTLVATIASSGDQSTATGAIMALQTVDMTNMTAALNKSASMLTSAANPKAIVMLSDGQFNQGGDPLQHLPSVPVYTIALGNDGQVQTMRDIATQTHGTFHLAPTPFDLADIYNEIIGQTQVAAVVANQKQNVNQNNFWLLPATILGNEDEATFSVSWTDWSVKYVTGTPTGNQINVSLRDPSGATTQPTPFATGNGFVVFKIPNPLDGTWNVAIWSSASGTLGTNGGAFDPHVNVQVRAQVPTSATIGQPVAMTANLHDNDNIISDAVFSASLEHPTMSPQEAVAKHRNRLDALAPHKVEEEASDNVRMLTLQAQVGPGERLLPYDNRPLEVKKDKQGVNHIEFTPAIKGAHIVRLEATGTNPKTGSPISRARRISVWAD